MSYRELRQFTEMLRALGYKRTVSMDNFRTPNFELVADILSWLLKRYDPQCDLPETFTYDQDRIQLMKQAQVIMLSKGRIKINAKRMYQADGYAVKELLKIASVLYSSMQHLDDDELLVAGQIDVSAVTSSEVRSIREIARELTQRGAALHELLGSEEQLRVARQSALARNPDLKDIENHISRTISAISSELQGTEKHIQSLLQDQRTLDGKIEKKRQDLERYEKRLRSLQTVRPAYMDEYELLEVELGDLFRIYLEKHRNLDYLQSQLDGHTQREKERMDENERKMREIQRKIKDDELSMMRGEREIVDGGFEDEFDLDEDSDSLPSGDIENDSFERRPSAARGGARGPAAKQQQQQQEESFDESDAGIGSEDDDGDGSSEDSMF